MQTISTWCDSPEHETGPDQYVAAQSYTISVNSDSKRGIDLCQGCYDKLLAPLLDLISMEGHSVEPAPGSVDTSRKNQPKVQCPYCDRKIPSERGLTIHKARMHKDLTEEQPTSTLAPNPSPAGFDCPICGRSFATRNGVSGHQVAHRNAKEVTR